MQQLHHKDFNKSIDPNFEFLHHTSIFFLSVFIQGLLSIGNMFYYLKLQKSRPLSKLASQVVRGAQQVGMCLFYFQLCHCTEQKVKIVLWCVSCAMKNTKMLNLGKKYSASEEMGLSEVSGPVRKSILKNSFLENRTNMNMNYCSFNITCVYQLKVKMSKY